MFKRFFVCWILKYNKYYQNQIKNFYFKSSSKLRKNNFIIWLKQCFNSIKISTEIDYSFNFKNANWNLTVIFLISFIVIPIFYNLIRVYGYHISSIDSTTPELWVKLNSVFMYFIPILGMSIAFAVDWNAMTKKGAWAAYTHFMFGIISSFFIDIILIKTQILSGEKNDPFNMAITFLVQVIFQFIGSIIIILTNKTLRKQIWTTLKEAKLDLLIWIIIFIGIINLMDTIFNAISNEVNNVVVNTVEKSSSSNQERLKLMTFVPVGAFVLVLGSVFLAPINEELSYRYGIFSIIRGKKIAYFASLIYFPAMHVMDSGDWNKIFGYLAVSIMAPLLFISTRGNTTYTIGLHMLLNAIATIYLFVGKK